MKRVFVDSGGFFDLLAREDRFHKCARALFQRTNSENWRLITTNAVVIETYALILTRAYNGCQNAIGFLNMMMTDTYQIERIRKGDEEAAIRTKVIRCAAP